MGINYVVDPQCYFRCQTLSLQTKTVNAYYQVAQRILAHPQTQSVILGSSRGENTSPLWLEKKTGLKTLNLSAGGAELQAKLTFLKIAEKESALRQVIWMADYFELIPETTDARMKRTPALRVHLKNHKASAWGEDFLRALQGLIDHNTFEASIHFLSKGVSQTQTQGSGSDIDTDLCESLEFRGQETEESLKKEVNLLFQSYTQGVIKAVQSPESWKQFASEMLNLTQKKIDVFVVIAPYHPDFLERLKSEQAQIYQRHLTWLEQLYDLQKQAGSHFHILNFFEGIPGTENSPPYWNDGVHYTCKSSILMLNELPSNL